MLLEFGFELIGSVLDAWIGAYDRPDTWASRIFWSAILILIGGSIWWGLR
jgi:hypothetical protein